MVHHGPTFARLCTTAKWLAPPCRQNCRQRKCTIPADKVTVIENGYEPNQPWIQPEATSCSGMLDLKGCPHVVSLIHATHDGHEDLRWSICRCRSMRRDVANPGRCDANQIDDEAPAQTVRNQDNDECNSRNCEAKKNPIPLVIEINTNTELSYHALSQYLHPVPFGHCDASWHKLAMLDASFLRIPFLYPYPLASAGYPQWCLHRRSYHKCSGSDKTSAGVRRYRGPTPSRSWSILHTTLFLSLSSSLNTLPKSISSVSHSCFQAVQTNSEFSLYLLSILHRMASFLKTLRPFAQNAPRPSSRYVQICPRPRRWYPSSPS